MELKMYTSICPKFVFEKITCKVGKCSLENSRQYRKMMFATLINIIETFYRKIKCGLLNFRGKQNGYY